MNEFLNGWKWDVYHILVAICIISFVSLFIWIIIDSINKNKYGKRK